MAAPKSTASAKRKTFVYSDFQEARTRILRAIQAGPFYGLLTGASGTGKTSLLREVAGSLDRHRFQVHYLAQSNASSAGIGRFLADALHLTPRRSHTETLRTVAQTLRALAFRILLFLDEAHLLGPDALQEIRLLAESEIDAPTLFTVLFSGLPELKGKFDAPALFPLKRRLSFRIELGGLKADEIDGFLFHRLGDQDARRLSGESIAAIFEHARGIPALVESLARACLDAVPGTDAIPPDALLETFESWDLI